VLFSLVLNVLGFSHLLITDLGALGMLTARGIQVRLAGAIGTDGKTRQQLLDILSLTRWARRNRRLREHEEFEFVGALAAPVLVNWHLPGGYRSKNPLPPVNTFKLS
jgi:hypothetical protein